MPPATMPDTGEVSATKVIEQVRRQLDEDSKIGMLSSHTDGDLDRIAARSVEILWARSRIKTFVAILALRQAREAIRGGTLEPRA